MANVSSGRMSYIVIQMQSLIIKIMFNHHRINENDAASSSSAGREFVTRMVENSAKQRELKEAKGKKQYRRCFFLFCFFFLS